MSDDIKENTSYTPVIATTPSGIRIAGQPTDTVGLFKESRNKRLALILPLYRQGLTHAVIAKQVGTSKASVSRDVVAARRVGLLPQQDGTRKLFRVAEVRGDRLNRLDTY